MRDDLLEQITQLPSMAAWGQAMREELERLREHAEPVQEAHFLKPERRATPTVSLAAHLLRGFL